MSSSKDCALFEEKLSAYLDGRLPSEQMAQVAAHLQTCASCSALLDKMSGLDKLAVQALTDFDDAALSDLDRRIAEEIDALPEPETIKVTGKSRIFPIWQKYVAVAASIAVLFLVGRMAFKENIPSLNSPTMQAPTPKAVSPAIDTSSQKPTPTSITGGKRIEEEENLPAKGIMPHKKDAERQSIDARVRQPKNALTQNQAMPARDVGKMKATESKQEIPAPATPAVRVMEKDTAQTEERGGLHNLAIEVQGIETSAPSATQKAATETQSDEMSEPLIKPVNTPVGSEAITKVESLCSAYQRALAAHLGSGAAVGSVIVGKGQSFAPQANSLQADSLKAANALLNDLRGKAVQPTLRDSLVSLYLQSHAHYDIYRFSQQEEHYSDAVRLKDSLQRMTVERIDTTAATAYLKGYLQEIERLQFSK